MEVFICFLDYWDKSYEFNTWHMQEEMQAVFSTEEKAKTYCRDRLENTWYHSPPCKNRPIFHYRNVKVL